MRIKIFIPFVSLLLLNSVYAQDSLRTFSFDKKSEKKIIILEDKLHLGEYDDGMNLTSLWSRKYKDNPAVLFQINLIKSKIAWQQLNFTQYQASFDKAIESYNLIPEGKARLVSSALLSNYLLDFNKTKEAAAEITKTDKAITASGDSSLILFHLLNKTTLNILQGYFSEAEKLLLQVDLFSSLKKSNAFYSASLSELFITKLNAEKKLLQLTLWDKKGNYSEAELNYPVVKKWISSSLGKHSEYYIRACALEGKHYYDRKKYFSASNSFLQAYQNNEGRDAEASKIIHLQWMIMSFIKSGDLIHTQNYSRRLLMFASQTSGTYDRFQLAYNQVYAWQMLAQNEPETAKERILKTLDDFNTLPVYGNEYQDLKALQKEAELKAGNIQGYFSVLENASATALQHHGAQAPCYHAALLERAMAELRYGKRFRWVNEIFSNSYDKVLAKETAPYSIANLNYLAAYSDLYQKLDRYDSAKSKSKSVLLITGKNFGNTGSKYALHLAHFIENTLLAGNYQEALDSLKTLYLLSDLKSGDTEDRQYALLAISGLYHLFGDYEKSQALVTKANRIGKEERFSRDIIVLAESASKEGELYIQSGNYSKAGKLLGEATTKVAERLGKDSPRLILLREQLVTLNLITGNYPECGAQLDLVRILIDSVYGNKSLAKADFLLRNGDYLLQINDYKGAEDAFKKSDQLIQQILGKKHFKRSEVLLRLAYLQSLKPEVKISETETIYKDALEIIKSSIGSSNPLFAETQEKYAQLLMRNASWEKSMQLLSDADRFWIAKLGNNNAHSTGIAVLKADIQYAKSEYPEAEKNYNLAKKNYENLFSNAHPSYLKVSGKLARTYYMKGQFSQAIQTMDEIIPHYLDFTQNYFPSLSFRQKSRYWNTLKDEFEFYTAVVFSSANPDKAKYTGTIYNNILSTKALLLSSSIKLLDKIINSNDSILIARYNQWIAEKEFLINSINLSKQALAEQGINISEIEQNIEQLEKEMSQRSELFNTENNKEKLSWIGVKNSLTEGECAIEIVRFRTFKKTFTDSIAYAVLFIRNEKTDAPEYVLMNNGKQMEGKFLKYYRNTATFDTKDEYSYNVFWKPIKNKIRPNERLYISSDGVYNQLNLEMLPDSAGNYVIDQNQIVLLTNTRDLLVTTVKAKPSKASKTSSKETKRKSDDRFVLCGNPSFYTSDIKSKNVQELPGAEKEVNEIYNLLVTSSKDSWRLINMDVKEDTVKKLVNPRVLHIATHGYFKESKTETASEDDIATHPLLNSGIMLMGSGDIIDNPSNKYVNQKDGILTALEAMDMSLDKTDLVVLSACETGRGSVQTGEGVYGLQRSFLLAGAKAVVISLFKVNDEVTQKLMLSFYQKWLVTGDKRQAFIDAKKEIKNQYKKPIYWGAFIMIEGKPDRLVSR